MSGMIRSVGAAAGALLAAVSLGACSSSAAPAAQQSSSTTTSSPAPTATTSTASPSPTSSATHPPAPLSPYEADPAVRALRVWAAAAARAINAGRITSPAFDAAMTAGLRATVRNLTGGEQGHQYPGPLPFTPTRVQVRSGTERDVRLCVLVAGYSLNPRTHKPFDKRRVQAVDAAAVRQGGLWLVSQFNTGSFSCAGVRIKEPTWSQS
jgi:hypothetical protein